MQYSAFILCSSWQSTGSVYILCAAKRSFVFSVSQVRGRMSAATKELYSSMENSCTTESSHKHSFLSQKWEDNTKGASLLHRGHTYPFLSTKWILVKPGSVGTKGRVVSSRDSPVLSAGQWCGLQRKSLFEPMTQLFLFFFTVSREQ